MDGYWEDGGGRETIMEFIILLMKDCKAKANTAVHRSSVAFPAEHA